ncbi:tetratricopeptide TPR_1 repeat-containing protein [Richelia sinica FACHB-800]|uniref:Tetratricopeptide TPR_1 repeat-containing protein n=1 Tax=Richelia sinica FACHB-800 TaxID=1357546 RepID=A0A975Y6S3_9NOST|nr:tetratricopeptide repeat protein [Richelia sinica]MBD2667510.1 tetratricopeptide repeat protein [Richelia sinica FACHB-800]QXE25590.1 tetratricopeptide TPR_1 repeat-containing protein [Richelia sinica FACHB-800]
MTHDFDQPEIKTQESLETINFSNPGELVLSQIGVNPVISCSNEISLWEFAHYEAIKNWSMYKPKSNASDLEKVKHYLNIFHHLCELEAWEKSCILIRLTIPTTKELHEQLGIWGYYNEQIELYSRILNKLNLDLDCVWLNGLGNAYAHLGKTILAIDCYTKQLNIARKINNQKVESLAHNGLGWVYINCTEESDKALFHYQQQLKISREIGDQLIEGQALSGLGSIYNMISIANYQLSIQYHKKSLAVAQEINDPSIEYNALNGIAANYINMGEPNQGIKYIQLQLNIVDKNCENYQLCNTLNNLASTYILLEDYDNAVKSLQKVLQIIKANSNKQLEAQALHTLGCLYIYVDKQYKEAINCFNSALIINNQIGNRLYAYMNRLNLAYCYGCLKEHQKAIAESQQVIVFANETRNKHLQGLALAMLANTYWHQGWHQGKCIWGLLLIVRSMLIIPPWKTANSKLTLKITIRTISQTLCQLFNQNWLK